MHDFDKYLKTIKAGFTVIIILAVFLPLLQFTSLSKDKKQENLAQFAKLMEEQQRLKDEKIALEQKLKAQQEQKAMEDNNEEVIEENQETIEETQEIIEQPVEEMPVVEEPTEAPVIEEPTEETPVAEEAITREAHNIQEKYTQEEQDEINNKTIEEILYSLKNDNPTEKDIRIARKMAEQKKQEQDLGAIRLYRAIHAITTNKEDLILLAELVMKTNAEIKILKKQYDRHIRRKPQDVKELRHIAHYLSKHPIENQE